jgi:hypothetical protein
MSTPDRRTPATTTLVWRPNTSTMTPQQVQILRRAFVAVTRNGAYAQIAGIHDLHGQHHTPLFLPWHRAYVAMLERALQKEVGEVAIPAWDWWNEPRLPDAFAVDFVDGEPNPLYDFELPPTVIKEMNESLKDNLSKLGRTTRSPGDIASLPGSDIIQQILAVNNFSDFTIQLWNIHDTVHVWTGGVDALVPLSAYDPINWALEASIDLIWRAWQLRHPKAIIPEDTLSANLEPMNTSVADVVDCTRLGYDYDGVADLEEAGRQLVLPGYFSDFVPDRPVDLLNLNADLNSLAWVIAARDTAPPLAIGLFGDWGSGKSTFMALLREQIDTLTGSNQQGVNPWCTNVRQIVFNAWYYAEDNLWASLVSHIFEELAVPQLFDQQGGSGLLGRIAAERAAATESLHTAAQREQQTQEALDKFSRSNDVFEEARAFGEALHGDETVGQTVEQAQEAVGLDAAKALDAAGRAASVVGSLGPRIQAFGSFLRTGGSRQRHRALLLLGIAVCLIVASVFLVRTVGWPAVLSALAAVAALAGVLEPLIKADQAIRESRISFNERRQALEAERSCAADERAAASAKLADIESGRFVNDYFSGRAASGDYQGHLSLVTTVRRDFQDLREWLRGETKTQAERVDRIVLYIDDLDRCEAPQVVRVLEAIHLMLALDLFVVVVGVDPRWLLTSLADQYSRQFGAVPNQREPWRATPQQYLEKIFQIPFNLLPMGRKGFARLVSSMLPTTSGNQRQPILASVSQASEVQTDASEVQTDNDETSILAQGQFSYARNMAIYQKRKPPVGLVVEQREIDFMSRLDILIPTPRAAKRLVNTYRLLRAPLSDTELTDFIGDEDDKDEPGYYRGVMILLAIMIAHPGEAEGIFATLIAAEDGVSWIQVLTKAGRGAEEDTVQLIKSLKDLCQRLKPLPPPSRMKPWISTVSRYSFRTLPEPATTRNSRPLPSSDKPTSASVNKPS